MICSTIPSFYEHFGFCGKFLVEKWVAGQKSFNTTDLGYEEGSGKVGYPK